MATSTSTFNMTRRSAPMQIRQIKSNKLFTEDDWPWKLNFDLNANVKPKICFMSGKEREYYPEKPGFSRHGVEYSMNCHPGDTPNPNYLPSENRLQKPISLKGYGIGGLSAPRFPPIKDPNDGIYDEPYQPYPPPPTAVYQNKIPPPPVSPFAVPSSHSQHHHHRHHDDDEEEEGLNGQESVGVEGKPSSAPYTKKVLRRSKKSNAIHMTPQECRNLLKQKDFAFGMSTTVPRFQKSQKWQNVGVGNYNASLKNCKKIPICNGFGRGPVHIPIPAKTLCDYEYYDKCLECNLVLKSMDYYRSKKRISIPQDYIADLLEYDVGDSRPRRQYDKDSEMGRPMFVTLCRNCYCEISCNGHEFWTKRGLQRDFEKIRHCYNVHEHNQLPVLIHKVSCHEINKLTRYEILMNKYFSDSCPRPVKEVS